MNINTFLNAYITCALWSSTDNSDDSGGDPLDDNYDADDIDENTKADMLADCASFCEAERDLLIESGLSDDQAGHDFWLTRNGHGTGFWDRGLGEVGDKLSAACKPYRSVDLYVGDDGKIHA